MDLNYKIKLNWTQLKKKSLKFLNKLEFDVKFLSKYKNNIKYANKIINENLKLVWSEKNTLMWY